MSVEGPYRGGHVGGGGHRGGTRAAVGVVVASSLGGRGQRRLGGHGGGHTRQAYTQHTDTETAE